MKDNTIVYLSTHFNESYILFSSADVVNHAVQSRVVHIDNTVDTEIVDMRRVINSFVYEEHEKLKE